MNIRVTLPLIVSIAAVAMLSACNDTATGPAASTSSQATSSQVASSTALSSQAGSSLAVSSVAIQSSVAQSSAVHVSSVAQTSSVAVSSSHAVSSSSAVLASSSASLPVNPNMDQALVGGWHLVVGATHAKSDTMVIFQDSIRIGNMTAKPNNGYRYSCANNVISAAKTGSSIAIYSYLMSHDTLFFNDPGMNWTTMMPNPVLTPVTRTDVNTKAYLRN